MSKCEHKEAVCVVSDFWTCKTMGCENGPPLQRSTTAAPRGYAVTFADSTPQPADEQNCFLDELRKATWTITERRLSLAAQQAQLNLPTVARLDSDIADGTYDDAYSYHTAAEAREQAKTRSCDHEDDAMEYVNQAIVSAANRGATEVLVDIRPLNNYLPEVRRRHRELGYTVMMVSPSIVEFCWSKD